MKTFIISVIFSSCISAVLANDIAEPAPIPDSLLLHANSVVITEEISIAITSADHYKQAVHRVILVLNDLGKEDGYFHESYDKFRKISDISVVVKQSEQFKASYSKKDCRD